LEGEFLATTRDAFRTALEISAFSLTQVSMAAAPLMTDGGSIVTMSYYGAEKVVHRIDGETVLEYGRLEIGGGNVVHYNPAVKKDGTPLSEGYLAIQAESAPAQFRKIEIMELGK